MTGLLNIEDQIRAMRSTWPALSLHHREGCYAEWRGPLQALFRRFTVSIAYRAPFAVESPDMKRQQPLVSVLDPPLRPRRGDPEGQLPHVYYVGNGALDVALCMFDPDASEWSPSMLLSETTVPWTVEWLASYEGWRATGRWSGGGRHLDNATLEGVVR